MKQNYTSVELSKKLSDAGCKLDSDYYWVDNGEYMDGISENEDWLFMSDKEVEKSDIIGYAVIYPAYDILNDICVRYAKDFFGDAIRQFDNFPIEMPAYMIANFSIINLLQQGEKDEAENYIWKNCKFNKNNK